MIATAPLRWSRSSLGWKLKYIMAEIPPRTLRVVFCGRGIRDGAVTIHRFVRPERRKITIAECRTASAAEALINPIHAENARHYVVGARYSQWDPEDGRIFIDAVWVPEFCEVPSSIRGYISKGCCSSHPGDPGTWWLHFDTPRLPASTTWSPVPIAGEQIALFA